MATSPNEIVRLPIERGAAILLSFFCSVPFSPDTCESLRKALFPLKDIMPAVAGSVQAVRPVHNREVPRLGCLQLLPGQGHGDWRAGHPPWRKRDVERLASDVHVVVDKDLAGALYRGPFHRDLFGMGLQQMPTHHLTDGPRLVERYRPFYGDIDVQAGLARSFHNRLERHLAQEVAQPESDSPAGCETLLVELGLGALRFLARIDVGVDVEHEIVGIVEHR